MQTAVMYLIRRLVPQQITIRTGIEKSLITRPLLLSNAKRQCTIRKALLDGCYKIADTFMRKITLLAAL